MRNEYGSIRRVPHRYTRRRDNPSQFAMWMSMRNVAQVDEAIIRNYAYTIDSQPAAAAAAEEKRYIDHGS